MDSMKSANNVATPPSYHPLVFLGYFWCSFFGLYSFIWCIVIILTRNTNFFNIFNPVALWPGTILSFILTVLGTYFPKAYLDLWLRFYLVPLIFCLFGFIVLCWCVLQIIIDILLGTGMLLIPFVVRYGLFLPLYAIIVLGLLSISIAFYRLRSTNRIRYGLIEIMVGVIGVIYTTSTIMVDPYLSGKLNSVATGIGSNLILQLLASMYIIVRGLTNIEDGRKKGAMTFWEMTFDAVYWLGQVSRRMRQRQ